MGLKWPSSSRRMSVTWSVLGKGLCSRRVVWAQPLTSSKVYTKKPMENMVSTEAISSMLNPGKSSMGRRPSLETTNSWGTLGPWPAEHSFHWGHHTRPGNGTHRGIVCSWKGQATDFQSHWLSWQGGCAGGWPSGPMMGRAKLWCMVNSMLVMQTMCQVESGIRHHFPGRARWSTGTAISWT